MATPLPPPTRAALGQLLSPWMETLRAMRVHPVLDPYSPTLWLQWIFPDNRSVALTRWLEAIELLVLLSRVDAAAWRVIALELRGASFYSFARDWTALVLEPRELPRVGGYDVVCSDMAYCTLFCEQLTAPTSQRNRLTPEYAHVRALLEAKVEEGVHHHEIPVRLRLNPRRPWRANLLIVLPSLAALAMAQQNAVLTEQREHPRLLDKLRSRVRRVVNEICPFTCVEEPFFRQMVEIYAKKIAFADLAQLHLKISTDNSGFLVNSTVSLLGTRASGTQGALQRVFVSDTTEPPVAQALLSAMVVSTSVREVNFGFDDASGQFPAISDRRPTVQWMAFVAFCAFAQNSLTKIVVRCVHLTRTHVAMMRELLEADDPLEILFPHFISTMRSYKTTRISASRVVLYDPTVISDPSHTVHHMNISDLVVLDHISGWWCVLLHGWGPAWVRDRDAVVSSVELSPNQVQDKIRSNMQLEMSQFEPEGVEAMLALLSVIGRGVTHLRLLDRERALDSWCPQVFDACPNLEGFVLWEAVPDRLAVFVECFASSRCPQLKRLSIGVELLTEPGFQELIDLVNVLAEPRHEMAQRLEALEIDVFCTTNGEDIIDSDALDVVLHMLENNARLAVLKVHLPLATTNVTSVHQVFDGLRQHHDVMLPTPVAPLGSREKMAFLSAIWGTSQRPSTAIDAIQQLDEGIVASIFEFVPERRRRLIDIMMPRTVDAETVGSY